MSLREKAKQAKRERIHAAARRLFSSRGVAATTIDQIARTARVATGTVFLYAPDKGALLAQVFCGEVAHIQGAALRELDPRAPFEEQLLGLFSAFYDYYGKDLALSRVFLKELLFSSERSPEPRIDADLTRHLCDDLAHEHHVVRTAEVAAASAIGPS